MDLHLPWLLEEFAFGWLRVTVAAESLNRQVVLIIAAYQVLGSYQVLGY
jgi:hypothetical protein